MSQRVSAYFLSDLHLGAGYVGNRMEAERRIVSFLDAIADDATHIYLLGDVLDYWYEYRDVVPKGYVRFFAKLAALSDAGVEIVWLAGNHDIWLYGYLDEELGIRTHDGSLPVNLGGRKFFLNHGDTVGKRPLKFRAIQSLFRNKVCQKMFSAIHPRWTVRFALNWSRHNREHDKQIESVADNALVQFSREYLACHPDTDYFIFGHLHILGETDISVMTADGESKAGVYFLGEWIHLFSYAHFDGSNLSLKQYHK